MRSSFIYVFELRTNLTSRSTFVHLRVRFVRSASKLIQPITADAFGAEHCLKIILVYTKKRRIKSFAFYHSTFSEDASSEGGLITSPASSKT